MKIIAIWEISLDNYTEKHMKWNLFLYKDNIVFIKAMTNCYFNY